MSVENYNFDLGKFKTVNDIKPKERALRFYQQVRRSIDERQHLRELDNPSLKFTKFRSAIESLSPEHNHYVDAEMELIRQDQADINDSKGDKWLANIIAQRQSMYKQEKQRLYQEADTIAQREREEERLKREACEWAMERTAEREKEREKERVLHLVRLSKANRITEEIRRKIWKQRKYYAAIDKGIADLEAAQAKAKKEKK